MSRQNRIYRQVRALHPNRSVFDLSYEKKFTCDMGQLIPVMCDEVVPGDFFKIGNQAVIRFQPLVAPVLHEVNMYVHYFFVPNRLMWDGVTPDNWETFITGGVDGDEVPTLPTWTPVVNTLGSLWDFFGFPISIDPGAGARPVDFPRRAYNMVYNEYYRDETHQTEVALTNEAILLRNWEKDYFTSALLEQQRGTAPALPIGGILEIDGINRDIQFDNTADATDRVAYSVTSGDIVLGSNPSADGQLRWVDPALQVDLQSATTFDVADLRLAWQIQKWMERNARAGVRYTEFLHAHFGVNPRDDRLQRPEYIGGSKTPIIFSEVLQTSETDTTPQGTLAGHGITVSDSYCGKYHAKEFGLIIGIMSVMPRPAYQEGINRQWLKTTKYDYFFPEFQNLSEQAIFNNEIYSKNADPTQNLQIWGYQGRYDELRTKQNMICSEMRSTFDYWHLGRVFGALPPLNGTFLECDAPKRIFADQADPGLIVSFANIIKAFRPLPAIAEPGLVDHN